MLVLCQIASICWIIEKAREFPEKKHLFLLIDYAKAFDCVYHNKLWKILKEMGIPDHLTCLLRNLYADQEATVRTGHGTTDWFQIGKGVHQGCHHRLNHMSLSNLRSLWMTGRPGVLLYMGSQRVGYEWATELNWIYWKDWLFTILYFYLFWHCLINYISGVLFLGSPIFPTELCMSSCVSTNLFWLL